MTKDSTNTRFNYIKAKLSLLGHPSLILKQAKALKIKEVKSQQSGKE